MSSLEYLVPEMFKLTKGLNCVRSVTRWLQPTTRGRSRTLLGNTYRVSLEILLDEVTKLGVSLSNLNYAR